jgi:hypothetical protein
MIPRRERRARPTLSNLSIFGPLALLGYIAESLDPVVGAFDFAVLARNNFAQRRGEIVFHRFFVFVHGGIFASLAFGQDGVIVSAGESRFQVDPRPMYCAGGAAGLFRFRFAQTLGLTLKLTRKARTLLRVTAEKRFQILVLHSFGGLFEAFLPILQRLDQTVDRRYDFLLLCHISLIRTAT